MSFASLPKLLLPLLLFNAAQAADLSSIGSWSQTLTASHLTAGAGSDLQNQTESVAGVTILTVSNAPGDWTLRARLGNGGGNWSGNFALFVKRTSAGSGSGSVSGAESYVEITSTDTAIFSGSEDRNNLSLQFTLPGLASNVSAATYLSSIIFTVQ